MSATTAPILVHLQELQRRLTWCAGTILVGAAAGFVLREPIIQLLRQPLGHELFYTSPQGGFDFVMKLCLMVGLLTGLPVIMYHLLRFVEPALPRPLGPRHIALVVLASILLTGAGAAAAFFAGLPAALHFFSEVGTSQIHPQISADRYLGFITVYVSTFALIFHLPLILLLINRATPLNPGTMGRIRKFIIVGSFALALVVPSAPDPLSQLMLAVPIILLYEVSIWLIRWANRRPHQLKTRTQSPAPQTQVPQSPTLQRAKRPAPRRTRPAQPLMLPQAPVRPVTAVTIDLSNAQVSHPIMSSNVLDLRAS